MIAAVPTRLDPSARLAELLAGARYEVIPLAGIEEQVVEHVPRDVKLTVTSSPVKGLVPTLELTRSLAAAGYEVVPHLAARLVRDRGHLAEILAQLGELDVRDVFVIGGDADEPAGEFDGAAPLLAAIHDLGHPFDEIGIAGYPERHPLIDDETLRAAMSEKARYATYLTSQICFDSALTLRFIDDVWKRGTQLPILVGIPGVVSRAKLLRVSTRIGIGESMRFLRKHGDFLARFLKPGGFSPDRLLDGLAPALADPDRKLAGFHVFTFNDLRDTEEWRRHKLEL